jgi:hypothetical protein
LKWKKNISNLKLILSQLNFYLRFLGNWKKELLVVEISFNLATSSHKLSANHIRLLWIKTIFIFYEINRSVTLFFNRYINSFLVRVYTIFTNKILLLKNKILLLFFSGKIYKLISKNVILLIHFQFILQCTLYMIDKIVF